MACFWGETEHKPEEKMIPLGGGCVLGGDGTIRGERESDH